MTITRAAKYLDHSDIGKTIGYPGRPPVGTISFIEHSDDYIMVEINEDKTDLFALKPDTEITLEGHMKPADPNHGQDPTERQILERVARNTGNTDEQVARLLAHYDHLHGEDQAERSQQTPPPVPAAQAADRAGNVAHYTIHEDGHIQQNVALPGHTHVFETNGRKNRRPNNTCIVKGCNTSLDDVVRAAAIKPQHHTDANPECGVCGADGGGHYDPACPEYCAECNYDSHYCPGCGNDVPHGTHACTDCLAEIERSSRLPDPKDQP